MSEAPVALSAGRETEAARRRAALDAARAARPDAPPFELALDVRNTPPERVSYLLFAPDGPISDLRPYARVKAVLSLWAGVETLVGRPDLPETAPVARMVEDGLTEGMRDYCVAHAMRAHVDLDATLARSRAGEWVEEHPPLARDRRVGVLGLGVLGGEVARVLAGLGFRVSGWSRSPRDVAGVACRAGEEGLAQVLAESDILIVLAPLTPETRGLLNAERLALLPKGAHVINAARGPLVVEADLLAALDADRVAGATLDVFDVEPLPSDHPYWAHPRVTVTPHVASVTRVETAAQEIVKQIARCEAGEPVRHLVDLSRGY
ncbi:MAG: NAD(P)-dependent oxidoreductase [Pseudomonadota bacterium]